MIHEKPTNASAGLPLLFLFIAIIPAAVVGIILAGRAGAIVIVVGMLLLILVDIFLMAGLFIVHPNQSQVVQLFGNYVGSQK